jgi:hypothetical protein
LPRRRGIKVKIAHSGKGFSKITGIERQPPPPRIALIKS